MKVIKLNGITVKLIPQIKNKSCKGCHFNLDDKSLANSCKVDLEGIPDEYCCGHAKIVYERLSLKEKFSQL